jgi:hypothetical protein
MSNLSDKEIDRLSREAADFYEPDDSSLSWSRLEQKLSDQMPERPPDRFRFGRINPYVWGSALVLVASVSFFMVKNIIYSKHSTRHNQTVTQTSKAPSNTTVSSSTPMVEEEKKDANLSDKSLLPLSKQSKDGTKAVESPNKNSDKETTVTTESQYEKTASDLNKLVPDKVSASHLSKNHKTAASDMNSGKKGKSSRGMVPAAVAAAATTVWSQSDPYSGDSGRSNDASGTAGGRNSTTFSLPLTVSMGRGPGTISGNDSVMNALAKLYKPQHKSLHLNRSLNFGLVFGPDYTDAGGIANNQLGNNIGFTAGYYLTSKLSINSGAIYSNKFYWSPRQSPSPQMFYNGGPQQAYAAAYAPAAPAPVEYINGAANMWEIPLTLRYDFSKNSKSKFFVNAGVSSYIIMNQTSIYFSHNGFTPVAWKKTNNEQVNYWFDVANISFGMETDIGKGFSFQFEPYLKLPLKKMGMENLTLNSYGMLISFRYAPVLSRSKK